MLESHGFPASIFLVVDAVYQRVCFWTERLPALYFDSRARQMVVEALIWRRFDYSVLPFQQFRRSCLEALTPSGTVVCHL